MQDIGSLRQDVFTISNRRAMGVRRCQEYHEGYLLER